MNIDDVHFRSRHFIYRTHGPLPTIAKSHAYINMYDTYVTCTQDMRKKTWLAHWIDWLLSQSLIFSEIFDAIFKIVLYSASLKLLFDSTINMINIVDCRL